MGGMQMGMPMQPQVGVVQPQMGMVVAPASVVAPGQVIQPAMGQALPMQPQGALPVATPIAVGQAQPGVVMGARVQ